MTLPSVAVLGVGGVGGTLSAVLSHGGVPLTCLVREPLAGLMRTDGLLLESRMFGRILAHPEVATRLDRTPDFLFIATKAHQLEDALECVADGISPHTIVIPLLNGLDHPAMIRERLGALVAPGSIRIEAELVRPGFIRHSSPFMIVKLASDRDVDRRRLGVIANLLGSNGIMATVEDSEALVLWEKLARLAVLACTTALSNRAVGFVRTDPRWRRILENALRESITVAARCGVPLSLQKQFEIIDGLPESLTTSMQRDIHAGRPSELDAVAGAVVRAGRKLGVPCPTLEEMIRQITATQRHQHLAEEGKATCRPPSH